MSKDKDDEEFHCIHCGTIYDETCDGFLDFCHCQVCVLEHCYSCPKKSQDYKWRIKFIDSKI